MSMSTAECLAEQSSSLLERTLKRLLGARGLTSRGLMSPSALEVHELIEQGLSSEDVIRFIESVELLHDRKLVSQVIGMSERTLYRRVKEPLPLSAEQSGRAWRFAELLTRAEDVLGASDEAQRWMLTPAMALEGRRPIDLISTQVGHALVDDLLTRMDYGVYS